LPGFKAAGHQELFVFFPRPLGGVETAAENSKFREFGVAGGHPFYGTRVDAAEIAGHHVDVDEPK
jgi:hypothetical protein